MNSFSKDSVSWVTVDAGGEGQRIDNFLVKHLKGVPKSHIYRILRSGEVRANSRRVDSTYRLQLNDKLRIPPIRVAAPATVPPVSVRRRLSHTIIYEDDALMVINKPAGIAVHGGSGIDAGVIEQLRAEHPECRFLELVHRLDRETSGVLLLAKKRSALTALHAAIREGRTDKFYFALVKGQWRNQLQNVKLPLHKFVTPSGERRVSVVPGGQASHTVFRRQEAFAQYTLLEAELKTGRTHQIRVHLSHLGFPIAGDDKYGDFKLNRALASAGLKRMFLHAYRMAFTHPLTGQPMVLEAPLPPELTRYLEQLRAAGPEAAPTP
jgi:23S rRNA pseudouridine955/2504/2580 synthase